MIAPDENEPCPILILLGHLFLLQDENLAIRLIVTTHEELLTLIIPADARQSPARALRQRGRDAVPRVLGGQDGLVSRLGVGRRDGVV